jgi:quinol monooxygenase YgiN
MSEVLEIATLACKPGKGDEFERALNAATAVIEENVNCLGAEGRRCVERPDEFVLLVRWTNVQAHIDFRAGPNFLRYRGHIVDFFANPPIFAHYTSTRGS